MDVSTIASAFVGAQSGQVAVAMAAKMLQTDAKQASSMANLIDQAAQSASKLANVGAGIGTNLDISV
jgi:hypothetical protein